MTPPRTTLVLTTSFDTRSATQTDHMATDCLDDRSECSQPPPPSPLLWTDFLSNIARLLPTPESPPPQAAIWGFATYYILHPDTFIVSVVIRPRECSIIIFWLFLLFANYPFPCDLPVVSSLGVVVSSISSDFWYFQGTILTNIWFYLYL